jgi:glucosamine 6-phosphate synthetase-like amidotransferase/phosphosugar isomerase protein
MDERLVNMITELIETQDLVSDRELAENIVYVMTKDDDEMDELRRHCYRCMFGKEGTSHCPHHAVCMSEGYSFFVSIEGAMKLKEIEYCQQFFKLQDRV